MKKTGILLIFMLIIVIVAVSGTSYAFYSASSVKLDFVITSGSGSVLSLEIDTVDNSLSPATNSSNINTYTAITGTDDKYAVYVLSYTSMSQSDIDVAFSITSLTYKNSSGTSLQSSYANYLGSILKFNFLIEPSTYVYDADNLPTPTNSWITSSGSINVSSITQGSGYILCYVKIDTTDLLLPSSIYNGVTMSFTISTAITTSE